MLSAYVAGRGNGEINVVPLFALPKVILKSLNKHILFFLGGGGYNLQPLNLGFTVTY